MTNETCTRFIEKVMSQKDVTPEVVKMMLPQICASLHDSDGAKERRLYDMCCTATSDIANVVASNISVSNNTSQLNQLCSMVFKSNHSHDQRLFNETCSHWKNDTSDNADLADLAHLNYVMVALLSPIGLLANVLILLTIYKVKRLRNTTGYFLCNLAVSDILLILIMLFYHFFYHSLIQTGVSLRVQLYLFPSIDVLLGSASLLHVTALSIERSIAVAMPLRYLQYLNERRVKVIVRLTWTYCLLVFLINLIRIWIPSKIYADVVFYFSVTCSFYIPCVFVMVSYSVIMISALKNMKIEKNITKVITALSEHQQSAVKSSRASVRFREMKIAVNVTTMTVPFVFGWGYFMVSNTYEMIADMHFRGFQNWLITFLPFFVSCANPLTYILFTRSLRKNCHKLLRRSCHKVTRYRDFKRDSVSSSSMYTHRNDETRHSIRTTCTEAIIVTAL